jgi:23S rRNA (adenine2030-N6)-methyltransferase
VPDGFGLHSSGMFILNPPYTLEPMLREVMPWLVKALGKDAARPSRSKKERQTGAVYAQHWTGGVRVSR